MTVTDRIETDPKVMLGKPVIAVRAFPSSCFSVSSAMALRRKISSTPILG